MTLRARMVLVFGLLILGVSAFMIGFFPGRMARQARASIELRATTVAVVMASALAPALEFEDADNAQRVLGWLASTPDARFAVVVGDTGARFAAWSPERVPAELPAPGPFATTTWSDDALVVSAPVVGRGGARGTLYVGQSIDQLTSDRDEARTTVGEATLVVLAIGLLACIVLATALVRPLRKLTTTAKEIARGARPPTIATITGGVEVVEMSDALGTMLARLADVNGQLVRASRHAGMAEVATGVLHNVGNILTSVNVGIDVVGERVAHLPVDRVRRAGELLAAGCADADKLAAGVRYVAAIADRLATERTAIQGDLVTLRGHVDHVNRVVSMQNAYARVGSVHELVAPETLVDEAIALGCPEPARHDIEIVRDAAGGDVRVDRHRVLQILVNLIANARDSIGAAKPAERRIAIRAAVADGWFEVRVDDTGGGVEPDLQLKIFSAGFTTKPKGHGYGLHSSALAAEQLGGSLRCESAGAGRGASFILRIPIGPEKASAHVE